MQGQPIFKMDHKEKTINADCPLCGTARFKRLFSKKGRDFWRCSGCGLEKQIPLPDEEELQRFYDNEYKEGLYETFTSADKMKKMTARQRIKEMSPLINTAGKWLDIGAANGVFVEEALKKGAAAQGIELSEHAVVQARRRNVPVSRGSINDLKEDEFFDCITAFDVLEHLLDPFDFLKKAATHLYPNGRLVLTVPNKASVIRLLMGKRWYFYIPEEHLHYFDPSIIRGLLKKAGLEVFSIKPTYKPLTFDYSLTQFAEYNTGIYRALKFLSIILPRKLREKIIPVYIGEIMIISGFRAE